MLSAYSEDDMSLVDTVFASIPAPLISDWGQTVTYIKTSTPRNYNPTTGNVDGADVELSVKAVITNLSARESDGLYQSTDLRMIISASELGAYYPTEADRIRYTQAGATREAKIVAVTSYRGNSPIMHTLILRPQ